MISNELIKLQAKSIFTVRSKPETLLFHSDVGLDAGLLNDFDPISLNDMDEVRMMRRFDSKYILDQKLLEQILPDIKNEYFILEINSLRIQTYRSIYYDTEDNEFYILHHNGKANRYKIRKRKYVNSGISFLEIKHKNNRGKTKKDRIPVDEIKHAFGDEEQEFIREKTSYYPQQLKVKFENIFNRITLVNKNFTERCTIDTDLQFHSLNNSSCQPKGLTIIELKQEERFQKTKLSQLLKERRVIPQGFSKYCLGRAMNEDSLKKNIFKPKLLQLERQFLLQ